MIRICQGRHDALTIRIFKLRTRNSQETEQVYKKMIDELLGAIDERSMINKKKQNGANMG